MAKSRIIVADDHVVVAQALVSFLKDLFDVVTIVSDGAKLVEQVRLQSPDLVIADIGMPGINGMQALRQMRREGLTAKVIFLTMYADAALARGDACGGFGVCAEGCRGRGACGGGSASAEGKYLFVITNRPGGYDG